jgi:hypothetical protein
MSALLALILAITPAGQSHNGGCAGGAVIFFERGSDRLEPYAMGRLSGYAEASRRRLADSEIYIESGGDGALARFNAALSRSRSEAIRSFLIARHFPADRIHIEIQANYGTRAPPNNEDMAFLDLIGHVYELVSEEEYARLFPPGVIVECF